MRRFKNPQGSEAILRPLSGGKYRLRIRDLKGTTVVSKIIDSESDAGPEMYLHGECWVELV